MSQIILESHEPVMIKTEHPNTPEQQDEIAFITEKMNVMYQYQQQARGEFNERTLKQYEDDNQKRINSYIEPRGEDLDSWQTRGFEGITREKMFAFVSKVAMNRPKYKFKATRDDGFIDKSISEAVEDFHTYTWNYEDPTSVEFFFDSWSTAGSGTCIVWEGVEQIEEEVEEIESYNIVTGELKTSKPKTIKSDINCKRRRVPLTNFFIWDWHQTNIQRQTYVAETQTLTMSDFKRTYGNYKNADKVQSTQETREMFGDSFFMQAWEGTSEDKVHVTHFYSQENGKKRYRIVANGVLILATPFARKDGKLPFARYIFKPFADSSFFYGKALPDEIAGDQDLYNAFKNMMLDRSILYIQRPMVGNGSEEVDDLVLRPHGIVNYKGDLKPLDLAPPTSNDIEILEYLRGAANRQTSDVQQSGQTGKGVTAREIVIADENARKLAGVARLFLEAGDLQATKLRIGNIFQFYFEPTRIEEVLEGEVGKMIYRTITLENAQLSDKKQGTKIIELAGTREELPSREELDIQEEMAHMSGFEMEKIAFNASYLKRFEVDLSVLTESSYEQSRSLELAMYNEYQLLVAKLYPQKFQQYQDVFFRELNDIYDKDSSQFEGQPEQQPTPTQQAMTQEAGAGEITNQIANPEMNSLAKLTGVQV